MKQFAITVMLMLIFHAYATAENYNLNSPDEKIAIQITVTDTISYSVTYNGQAILSPSRLSLTLDNAKTLGNSPVVIAVSNREVDNTLYPAVRQKTRTIKDHYKELTLRFPDFYSVSFRAYNDGIAYRFQLNQSDTVTVLSEQIEYKFPQDYNIYFPKEASFYTHQERQYLHQPLSQLPAESFSSIPALIETKGPKVLITESDLIDYPGFYLQAQGNTSLKALFPKYPKTETKTSDRDLKVTETEDYIAQIDGTRTLPWRALVIAQTDADLVLSQLIYKLASPCQIEDTSWIKPGKVAWDWWNAFNSYGVDFRSGVNNDNYKYYIDFASKYGIEYIILDEGWYKQEDLLHSVDAIDIPELMAYGKQKNVQLILWTSWLTLDRQFNAAMDQFQQWGVAGLKVDFMQRDDQKMVQYYEKVAAECAKRKMLVDFHGSYKPAGLRRRFPNVITREGVFGNEQAKWSKYITPSHRLTLPFIRQVAGPMDFTPGAMRNFQTGRYTPINSRPGSQGTRCHEMSMYVLFESPLQMLCDNPSQYIREPECMEFLSPVPTVWDDTKVLDAKITEYLYMARKRGTDWYLGGMTNEQSRTCKLDLSFLDKDAAYTMTLFKDGINADRYAEDYKKTVQPVSANQTINVDLAANGGFVARIVEQ